MTLHIPIFRAFSPHSLLGRSCSELSIGSSHRVKWLLESGTGCGVAWAACWLQTGRVQVWADHHVFWILDIPPCLDSELTEFPLRMRDWLKNVLVTLYERDEDNNLLTEKQKLRVSRLSPAWPCGPWVG